MPLQILAATTPMDVPLQHSTRQYPRLVHDLCRSFTGDICRRHTFYLQQIFLLSKNRRFLLASCKQDIAQICINVFRKKLNRSFFSIFFLSEIIGLDSVHSAQNEYQAMYMYFSKWFVLFDQKNMTNDLHGSTRKI